MDTSPLDALRIELVRSMSDLTAGEVTTLVMDPWLELRAELQATPLAA